MCKMVYCWILRDITLLAIVFGINHDDEIQVKEDINKESRNIKLLTLVISFEYIVYK